MTAENKRYREQRTDNYGKMPPQAVELEQAVLGALMLERNTYVIVGELLKPECFYKEAHQRIFGAMCRLHCLTLLNHRNISIIL